MRKFETGATRDEDQAKNDYEGFISPAVLEVYGDYMSIHRKQADGQLRDSDNWQKGIPRDVYIKSLWRHFLDLWFLHRGIRRFDKGDGHEITVREACCASLFNLMGYLFEELREDAPRWPRGRRRSSLMRANVKLVRLASKLDEEIQNRAVARKATAWAELRKLAKKGARR